MFWDWVDASSETAYGRALETNARIVVEDVESSAEMADSLDLAEYRRCGLRAVQATPLISRNGKRLGMLSTHWREPHQAAARDFGSSTCWRAKPRT